jgi:hypothetical protein
MVVHACHLSLFEAWVGWLWTEATLGGNTSLYLKHNLLQKARGVA